MSQCARIAAFLADGEPHRMEDIHRAVGFCRLNSRVAELRGRGYDIRCDRTGGQYVYRLVGTPDEAAGGLGVEPAAVSSGGPAEAPRFPSSVVADWGAGPPANTEQLSLGTAA